MKLEILIQPMEELLQFGRKTKTGEWKNVVEIGVDDPKYMKPQVIRN